MIIACYTTQQGEKSFGIFESLDDFSLKEPNAALDYAFDKKDEIITKDITEEREFNIYAPLYGFAPSDYKRHFYDNCIGQEMILIGFRPQNRKYKCLAYAPALNKKYKITPRGVRLGFDLYKQRSSA